MQSQPKLEHDNGGHSRKAVVEVDFVIFSANTHLL